MRRGCLPVLPDMLPESCMGGFWAGVAWVYDSFRVMANCGRGSEPAVETAPEGCLRAAAKSAGADWEEARSPIEADHSQPLPFRVVEGAYARSA